jgi:hypothetical protein
MIIPFRLGLHRRWALMQKRRRMARQLINKRLAKVS